MSTASSPAVTGFAKHNREAHGVMQPQADRPWLDRIGITASLACAVHCLAAPFLLLLLPAAGSAWSHPAVHWVMAVLVLPLALWVIYRGYLKHRKTWTLVAAGAGSACIVAGLILPMVSSKPVFSIELPALSSTNPVVMAASSQAPLFIDLADDDEPQASTPSFDWLDPALAAKGAGDIAAVSCTDPGCCPADHKQGPAAVDEDTQAPVSTGPDAHDKTAAAHAADAQGLACTHPACCPLIAQDTSTGAYSLSVPPGGLTTLIGSLLLVFAHASNLVACRCYAKAIPMADDGCGSACGCPTA